MRLFGLIGQRKFVVAAILIAVAVVFIVRQFIFSQQKKEEIAVVKKGDVVSSLTLSGEIDALEKVALGFQVSGQLAWVGAKEGDNVFPNQTIATLDQRTALKSLQKSLLDYSITRNAFDQVKEDNQNRTIDEALTDKMKRVLQDNQNNLDKATVSVELQDLSRQQSILLSPIRGTVTKANGIFANQTMLATERPFEIVNPQSLYLKVNADQTEIVRLRLSQKGTVVFDSYPDEEIPGTISSLSFAKDERESGTVYNARVSFDSSNNASYKYRLGMTGDVTFTLSEKKNVLTLPFRFVKSDERGKYVYLGQKKKKVYVKTGLESDIDIEIADGLSEGDVIYD